MGGVGGGGAGQHKESQIRNRNSHVSIRKLARGEKPQHKNENRVLVEGCVIACHVEHDRNFSTLDIGASESYSATPLTAKIDVKPHVIAALPICKCPDK